MNYGERELIGLADNPPVHTEFRKLVSGGFTPRQVEAVEPEVRRYVKRRVARLHANGDGGGDIVTELFTPLPSMVVAHYLGVPEGDRVRFDDWTEAIVAANTAEGGITSALETLGKGLSEMMSDFTASIEKRRTDPEDDTVSHLVAAGVGADGDIAGVLSILAMLGRTVTRDVTIKGTTIPAGRRVMIPLRLRQSRRTPIRFRRSRTRCHAPAAQHSDVQPRGTPLPRRHRRAHAGPRRAGGAVGADPELRVDDVDSVSSGGCRAPRQMAGARDDLALTFPGRDRCDERAMLEEFVVPLFAPRDQALQ